MMWRAAVLLMLLALAACEANPLDAAAWRWTGGDRPDLAATPVP
jgi:hypothetical protein